MSFFLLDLLFYSLCITTSICDILIIVYFKNIETCFEKSEVLNDFINDVSKSRSRDFCSRNYGERGDT